jgi:hypothetical protein
MESVGGGILGGSESGRSTTFRVHLPVAGERVEDVVEA